ncbi:MAG: hypothetical protein ACRYFW_10835 [Janthinobacterium lividum]
MATFTEQPVRSGYGEVHVNYFRVFLSPRAGEALPTGRKLIDLMPTVMNPHTACVSIDKVHRWHGAETLKFRGVARLRPVALVGLTPIPLPKSLERYGLSEEMRASLVPQIHTDSVGLAAPVGPHAFTVQTLKREFETEDDRSIRRVMGQYLEARVRTRLEAIRKGLARPQPRSWTSPLTEAMRWVEQKANEEAIGVVDEAQHATAFLCGVAIGVNQHHFLAGRRAFRMGTIKELSLTRGDLTAAGLNSSGTDAPTWVFETAAVERYSMEVYAKATDWAMGGDTQMLRPVWTEMCGNVAKAFGSQVGTTTVVQKNFGTLGAAMASDLYRGIGRRHRALVPGC